MSEPRFSTDGLNTAKPNPNGINAADANFSGEWNDIIGKLGFTVIVIQMERCQEIFKDVDFYKPLGEEMTYADLGHYDSSQWHPRYRHFFYAHTQRLAEALEFLKTGLKNRGLLNHSAIGHFDATEKIWREFHPGVATP
jgi:hypothetical protein